MKFRHKRNIRRVVAWITAFLLLFAASFGNWIVLPFAVGFALVQLPFCFTTKNNNKTATPATPSLEAPVIVLLIEAIMVFIISNVVCSFLCLASGAAGIILSCILLKVETGKSKKKICNKFAKNK